MIQVLRKKGYYDYVDPKVLDELIEHGEIISFRRGDKVVVIGEDPARTRADGPYHGVERRHPNGHQ
jgi:hypothetical protein